MAPDENWLGPGRDIVFEPDDWEILDTVVGLMPELRICALALKRARAQGVQYPIDDRAVLAKLIGGKKFEGGGHEITVDDITAYLPDEFLPIAHDGDFVSRVYASLLRCRQEMQAVAGLSARTLTRARAMNKVKG